MAAPTAKEFLGRPITADYRPTYLGLAGQWYDHRGWFSLYDVERMRRDPQVNFGMRILRAPLHTVTWTVESDRGAVSQWVDRTLKFIWERELVKLTRILEYGYMGGENCWHHDPEMDTIEYTGLRDLNPFDIRPLAVHGALAGLSVKGLAGKDSRGVWLRPPRSFWLANEPEYGNLYGRPRIAPAWYPWMEKMARHGAVDIRRLWFLKNAYRGGIIRHPIGTIEVANGQYMSNQDYARELVEKMETGGVLALPNISDERGNQLWTFEEPKINGDPSGVREYPQDLDKEILVGMGIQPEVAQAAEVGGGWSGRSVPFLVFLTSEDQVADCMFHGIDEQILRPGVDVNFGEGAKYKVTLKSLVPPAEDKQAKKQGKGPGDRPGGGGQPAQSDNEGGGGNGNGQLPQRLSHEGGFTGVIKDSLGRVVRFRDGKRVAAPEGAREHPPLAPHHEKVLAHVAASPAGERHNTASLGDDLEMDYDRAQEAMEHLDRRRLVRAEIVDQEVEHIRRKETNREFEARIHGDSTEQPDAPVYNNPVRRKVEDQLESLLTEARTRSGGDVTLTYPTRGGQSQLGISKLWKGDELYVLVNVEQGRVLVGNTLEGKKRPAVITEDTPPDQREYLLRRELRLKVPPELEAKYGKKKKGEQLSFDESKHPRGQPENAGEFSKKPGGGSKAKTEGQPSEDKASPKTPHGQWQERSDARTDARAAAEQARADKWDTSEFVAAAADVDAALKDANLDTALEGAKKLAALYPYLWQAQEVELRRAGAADKQAAKVERVRSKNEARIAKLSSKIEGAFAKTRDVQEALEKIQEEEPELPVEDYTQRDDYPEEPEEPEEDRFPDAQSYNNAYDEYEKAHAQWEKEDARLYDLAAKEMAAYDKALERWEKSVEKAQAKADTAVETLAETLGDSQADLDEWDEEVNTVIYEVSDDIIARLDEEDEEDEEPEEDEDEVS